MTYEGLRFIYHETLIKPILIARISCFAAAARSFVLERRGKVVAKRRFDHFFSSRELIIKSIEYLHKYRENGLSDHSPLELVIK